MTATSETTTDRVISQGRALVRAIEALYEIEPSSWFGRLLLAAYRRRLRGIIAVVPGWVREKILDVPSGGESMVLWVDED